MSELVHSLVQYLDTGLLIVSFILLVLVAGRQAQYELMRRTIQTQGETINAQEKTLAALEQRLESVENDSRGWKESYEKAADQNKFKDEMIRLLVEAVAASGVCVKASWCPDRTRPQTDSAAVA